MKKDDHYLQGSLLKSTGNKGEIILKFNSGLSDKILKLESILVEVDGKLVPFFIENIKTKSSQTVVVKIDGIDSEEKSLEFIGADFYLSEMQLQELDIESNDYIDVDGYLVKDSDGNIIGTVIEFIDIPKNPLLSIKTESREVTVPANENFIIEIDDDEKLILMEIPEGLLDINL